MNTQEEDTSELKQLGPMIRGMCFFISLCSVFALISVIVALVLEPFHYTGVMALIVCGICLHVSGSILFTGFTPSYLLFAHGKVKMGKP